MEGSFGSREAKLELNRAISVVFGRFRRPVRIDSQAAPALKNGPIRAAWPPGLFSDISGLPSAAFEDFRIDPMKVRNSLKSLRGRHRANRLVRRKGRVYVINKVQRRFKARQG